MKPNATLWMPRCGVDASSREQMLSDADFQSAFGSTKDLQLVAASLLAMVRMSILCHNSWNACKSLVSSRASVQNPRA